MNSLARRTRKAFLFNDSDTLVRIQLIASRVVAYETEVTLQQLCLQENKQQFVTKPICERDSMEQNLQHPGILYCRRSTSDNHCIRKIVPSSSYQIEVVNTSGELKKKYRNDTRLSNTSSTQHIHRTNEHGRYLLLFEHCPMQFTNRSALVFFLHS